MCVKCKHTITKQKVEWIPRFAHSNRNLHHPQTFLVRYSSERDISIHPKSYFRVLSLEERYCDYVLIVLFWCFFPSLGKGNETQRQRGRPEPREVTQGESAEQSFHLQCYEISSAP